MKQYAHRTAFNHSPKKRSQAEAEDPSGASLTGRLMVQFAFFCFFLLITPAAAFADAVLLIEEPINFLGHLTEAGHSAILLDQLCSDDHITMRPCIAGEPGSVVSRYNGMAHYDWLAMNPAPYLFAVDSPDQIPSQATRAEVNTLRERYRARQAHTFAADLNDKAWLQLVGAAYRRRIICIRIHTTEEQNLRLMAWLNALHNRSHFNLFFSNCSDFMRRILDVLFPGSVHRNLLFDAGMTTPKQLASGLHHYASHHPELEFEVYVINQIPGDIARSGKLYGVTQSFVKTKPYFLALGAIEPLGIGCVVASALFDHRYNIQSEVKTVPVLHLSDPAASDDPDA